MLISFQWFWWGR